MKNLRICSFVFLIVGLCATGYADEHFPFLAQISKESVNVRAGANTNFERLIQLNQGTEVIVLGKSYDWYKIQLPATTKVYIRGDYLKIKNDLIAEIMGDKVNIRAGANSDSTSLGIINKGGLVMVTAQVSGWSQIEAPVQAAGWIRKDFLTVKSLTVDAASLTRKVLPVQEQVDRKPFATIEVKGQLTPLAQSKAEMRYQLTVDGKTMYYVQSIPNIDRFKGAFVIMKGLVISDRDHQLDHPVFHVINISLLL